jgi:hypothetical protein
MDRQEDEMTSWLVASGGRARRDASQRRAVDPGDDIIGQNHPGDRALPMNIRNGIGQGGDIGENPRDAPADRENFFCRSDGMQCFAAAAA